MLADLKSRFQACPSGLKPVISKGWISPSTVVKLERIDSELGGARRYTDSKGQSYVSVTTLLSLMECFEGSKAALAGWEKYHGKEEADRLSRLGAIRGTAVHTALEEWIQGQSISTLDGNPLYIRLFNQIVDVIHSRVHSFLASELQVKSSVGFAGTLDAAGYIWNEDRSALHKGIIDFKNYARAKEVRDIEQAFYQVALYSNALEQSAGVITETALIIASNESGSEACSYYLDREQFKQYKIKALAEAIKTIRTHYGTELRTV